MDNPRKTVIELSEGFNPFTQKVEWVACYDDDDDHRHGHGPTATEALADLLDEEGR